MTARQRLSVLAVLIILTLSTLACSCLSEEYARQNPQTCDGPYAAHPPTITPALTPVPLR